MVPFTIYRTSVMEPVGNATTKREQLNEQRMGAKGELCNAHSKAVWWSFLSTDDRGSLSNSIIQLWNIYFHLGMIPSQNWTSRWEFQSSCFSKMMFFLMKIKFLRDIIFHLVGNAAPRESQILWSREFWIFISNIIPWNSNHGLIILIKSH